MPPFARRLIAAGLSIAAAFALGLAIARPWFASVGRARGILILDLLMLSVAGALVCLAVGTGVGLWYFRHSRSAFGRRDLRFLRAGVFGTVLLAGSVAFVLYRLWAVRVIRV